MGCIIGTLTVNGLCISLRDHPSKHVIIVFSFDFKSSFLDKVFKKLRDSDFFVFLKSSFSHLGTEVRKPRVNGEND